MSVRLGLEPFFARLCVHSVCCVCEETEALFVSLSLMTTTTWDPTGREKGLRRIVGDEPAPIII